MTDVSIDLTPPDLYESERESPKLIDLLAMAGLEAKKKSKPPVDVPNPFDDRWGARFKTVVPQQVTASFWKKMEQEKIAEANMAVLTAQVVCILAKTGETEDGTPTWDTVVDDDGSLVSFHSERFAEIFGGGLVRKAIESFYGGADGIDGALPNIGWVTDEIFRAAGIGVKRDAGGRPLG